MVQWWVQCKEPPVWKEQQHWQELQNIFGLLIHTFCSTVFWRDFARRRSWAWFQAGRWKCTRSIWLLLKQNGRSDFDSQFLSLDMYLVCFLRRPSQSLCQEVLGPGRERRLGRISLYSNALTVSSSLSPSTTLPFLRPFLSEEGARLITSSYWHLIRDSCMICMDESW